MKFNPQTIETSIGGTDSPGNINVTLSSVVSTDDSTIADSSYTDNTFSSDSSTGDVSVIYRPTVAKAIEMFSQSDSKTTMKTQDRGKENKQRNSFMKPTISSAKRSFTAESSGSTRTPTTSFVSNYFVFHENISKICLTILHILNFNIIWQTSIHILNFSCN